MRLHKLRFQLSLLLIFLLTSYVNVKSQDEEFPVGLYSANSQDDNLTSTDTTYYNKMKELGANRLIIQPDETTKQRYETGIPIFVYYYKGGYYKKWYAKDGISETGRTGLKKQPGVGEMDNSNNYWVSKSTQTTGLLLEGPNYRQDKTYRIPQLMGQTINYIVRIRYKVDEVDKPPVHPEDVCKIVAEYKYSYDGNETLGLDSLIINTQDAAGQFKYDTLTYNYNSIINTYRESCQKLIENTDSLVFNDNNSGQGLNIRFEYFGQSKIYIDYIEIYDNEIGDAIKTNPSIVRSNILDYINAMPNRLPSTLEYWYSFDEPSTLDNNYPYNFINDILKNLLKSKPVITTIYPVWNK